MAIDPTVNFDGFLEEKVAEIIAKGQNPNGQTPVAPLGNAPIELNIGGQTFTYKDKADMEQAINNFTQTAIQQVQAAQQQAQNQGSFATGDDKVDTTPKTGSWNDDTFVEKMKKSPKEGFEWALNQLIFDGQSQDPSKDIKENLRETELLKRTLSAYQFKEKHPEFPGGEQAANVIDKVRDSMGLPYDINGLEAAYVIAMQRGHLPNYYQAAMQQQMQQQAQFAQDGGQNQQYNPQPQFNQGPPQQIQRPLQSPFAGQTPMPLQNYGGNPPSLYQMQNPYLAPPPGGGRGNAGFTPGGMTEDVLDGLTLDQLETLVNQVNQGKRR